MNPGGSERTAEALLLEKEGTFYQMMDGHLLSKVVKGQDEGGDVRRLMNNFIISFPLSQEAL